VSFFLDLIVALPQAGPLLTVSWAACASLLLVVAGGLPRLRGNPGPLGVLVLIPGLYCALFIAASWLRPMLLARVATWLVIPLCLILAQAALGLSGLWRRRAACVAPLLNFPIQPRILLSVQRERGLAGDGAACRFAAALHGACAGQ
jgi:hypothetical protein